MVDVILLEAGASGSLVVFRKHLLFLDQYVRRSANISIF